MADNDYTPGSMDITDQKSTYQGVMAFGANWGVPLSLGLTMFFTALLMQWGILGSLFAGIVVVFLTKWVVATFFSH